NQRLAWRHFCADIDAYSGSDIENERANARWTRAFREDARLFAREGKPQLARSVMNLVRAAHALRRVTDEGVSLRAFNRAMRRFARSVNPFGRFFCVRRIGLQVT